ncbi:apolipoprotein N-acyltransferase [soil metagenome]
MIRLIALAGRIGALAGWRRYGLALLAGAAAGLSMPPFDLWPLLFIACPVFFWLGEGTETWRRAFLLGWCFGLGYFIVCLYWIGEAFLVDAATYLWMMPFMVGGLAGGMALYWGFAAAAAHLIPWRGISRLLLLVVALSAAEWLRGRLFTGFPWAAPGLAAIGMGPLAQAAALVGMTGLTVLILLWSFLPALLGLHRSRGAMIVAAALFATLPALAVWGEMRLAGAGGETVPGVRLRIVQPNIPQNEKWRDGNARAIFEKLIALSNSTTLEQPQGIAGVTHLIWPESSVPFFIEDSAGARDGLAALLPDGTALIMGALRHDDAHVFNSVLVFNGRADVVARYDKWRLVPGGEFLPFEWLLEPLGFRKVVTVPGSFAAGPGPLTLAIPGAPPAGILICYEAIFPDRLIDAAHRPGWLINVTNDGWFGQSSGPYQHLAQARIRAIEQGLPMARAANTGISAIVDSLGHIRASLPLGQEGVLDGALPVISNAYSLYAAYGDGLFALLIVGLLLIGFQMRTFT